MYINSGSSITNTPQPRGGWNTLPYTMPESLWYRPTPYYYVDHTGKVQVWNSLTRMPSIPITGGQYKGTPTRTGSFYIQNTV